ncbi:septum formation initiator family protein [Patescibacteria group bacterium]|nr:septum formation initiator family protein [Patescibacteria group bacterium]
MKWHTASTERQGRPIALFLAIGFVCITGLSAVRELYRQNQVKADMTTLQDRVAKLEDRKATVSQLLQQLQTPEVIDRDARLRLNMQRPGERVYILRGENWEKIATDPAGNAPVLYVDHPVEPIRSNPERWLRFFFVHESNSAPAA